MTLLDDNLNPSVNKERHGCVTAWLVIMIVLNSITALFNILGSVFIASHLPTPTHPFIIVLLGLFGLGNVLFAVLLLKWKRFGFWGFVASSFIVMMINISMGAGISQSLMGLIGVGVLYAILQIRKNDVSAWDNLE